MDANSNETGDQEMLNLISFSPEISVHSGSGEFGLDWFLMVVNVVVGFLGSIVPSTILSSRFPQSATLKNPTDKFWERRVSNLGLLGELPKRYLCAMPPPQELAYLN